MAARTAIRSGNWSSTSTWQDGVVPSSGDDVNFSNYIVNLNIASITVGVLTAGTGFLDITCSGENNITFGSIGNYNGDCIICVSGEGDVTFNGDFLVNAKQTGPSYAAVVLSLTGLVTINGDVENTGIINESAVIFIYDGDLVVNGDVTGGSSSSGNGNAINSEDAYNITINGSIHSSLAGGYNNYGLNVSNIYSLIVTGDVVSRGGTCQSALVTYSVSSIVINGRLIGGSDISSPAFQNFGGCDNIVVRGSLVFGIAAPYVPANDWSGELTLDCESCDYIEISGVRFALRLPANEVMSGVNHGGIIGTLAASGNSSPFRRNKVCA